MQISAEKNKKLWSKSSQGSQAFQSLTIQILTCKRLYLFW